MNKSMQNHLENINVDELIAFKEQKFTCYAHTFVTDKKRRKLVELGFLGNGQYAVVFEGEIFSFSQPFPAIEKYKELCNQRNIFH